MEKRLTEDLNVVSNSNLEIQLLDGDLNIIQKLDDEPNDVGGLTSAELKAKFDESGNIIKKYINETLIPSVLTDDATEESRKQAESARVAAEQGRVTAEEGRVSAETARAQAEASRTSAETARGNAESQRASAETTRVDNETARNQGETARVAAENVRANAETARDQAEQNRAQSETARDQAETARRNSENIRATSEEGRVQAEQNRVSAEQSRTSAEAARETAEKARADENTGIVAQATAQANAAAQSAEIASASAQTAQNAASSAGTAASTASSAAAAASGSASQAQASAAAAAQSATSVDGINKTAQSWAVGGTNTRPGEDTDNAKYWAKQAQAVVGGDFATKVEAQGYVTTHNQSADAHSDIREALSKAGKPFIIEGTLGNADGDNSYQITDVSKSRAEVKAAVQAGELVMFRLNAEMDLPLASRNFADSTDAYIFSAISDYVYLVTLYYTRTRYIAKLTIASIPPLSDNAPSAPGTASAGTSYKAARADHVHPKEVSDDDRAAWNGKAAGKHASQHGTDGADPITPAAIGAASLGADGKVPASQLPEISSVKTYTATIGTTWVEDENTGVKTQSVAIAGVKATNTATVDHVYTGAGTSDDYAAFVEAENQYLNCITNGYAETYNGGIKFTIFGDANTVAIPIVAEVS